MPYLQLEDYALIGNGVSAALISRLGSVDWLCLPYLDSSSQFSSLQDENHGGRFQILPLGDFRSEQRYLQRTLVLETLVETPHGRGVITDWMPMGESALYRKVEVVDGKITWSVSCAPRFADGAHGAHAEKQLNHILFRNSPTGDVLKLYATHSLEINSNRSAVTARFPLSAAESASFSLTWGRTSPLQVYPDPHVTIDFWKSWSHRCPPEGCVFAGPWHDTLLRSGLILKVMMAEYSGSISETVKSAQPLMPRFGSVKSTSLAIRALASMGYTSEAKACFSSLMDLLRRDEAEGLQPIYTLDGGKSVYRMIQGFSLETFCYMIFAATDYYQLFKELPAGVWPFLADVTDFICQAWRRPDVGPWSFQSKPEHFVSSKALCWFALKQASWLAQKTGAVSISRWTEERKTLFRLVCDQGYDQTRGIFIRGFGDPEIDSSTLIIPLVKILPWEDPRVQRTVNGIQTELSQGVLIQRTQNDPEACMVSSLLFVSCLATSGLIDEASDRLAELCTYGTSLGIFGEKVDPRSGEIIGNFPSAATHLALIHAGLQVGLARGRQLILKSA